ncbi:MAG TPA: nucleotidyltransferase family protein [Rhodanobacteraceae bacterium]|jgi:MurNAc alpha-1-phosphate uridylyltransferase|nr:nucleotidyltransferase family protein [Rhodanobacteraceae bacterium]
MKALIFAAGLGERMRPLTDTTPKPLLAAGGKRLIEWHLERLAATGVRDVVINIAHLAEQFPTTLGDGSRYGVRIEYSREGTLPLETGGGMLHAQRLLGDAPFIAVNGDTYTDYDFAELPAEPRGVAELVLVDNPPQHPQGDFGIDLRGVLLPRADSTGCDFALTFAGIGVYRPQILADWQAVIGDTPGARATPPRFSLTPLLRAAITRGDVAWQHHRGFWTDVGTPQRLAELAALLGEQG